MVDGGVRASRTTMMALLHVATPCTWYAPHFPAALPQRRHRHQKFLPFYDTAACNTHEATANMKLSESNKRGNSVR